MADALPLPETGAPAPPDAKPEAPPMTLVGTLHELAALLPGLKAALERTARRIEPPVAYRKEDAARLLGISPRLLARLASAGKFPRPDAYAGRCPLWTRGTLEGWVRQGGGSI